MTEQQQYQITEYAQRCRALDASALAQCRFCRLDYFETSLKSHWRNSRFLLGCPVSKRLHLLAARTPVSAQSRGKGRLANMYSHMPSSLRSKA